jgi:hypothetical protein
MINKGIIRRKRPFLLIILAVFLVIALYKYFEYQASSEYIDQALPFYAQDKWNNKIIYAENPKKIAQNMLAGEEYFKGALKLIYLDIDKAEITMRNYGTGDDTKEAIEYYVIAEKKLSGWEIMQFKMHWKCSRGLYWPRFWTTGACI